MAVIHTHLFDWSFGEPGSTNIWIPNGLKQGSTIFSAVEDYIYGDRVVGRDETVRSNHLVHWPFDPDGFTLSSNLYLAYNPSLDPKSQFPETPDNDFFLIENNELKINQTASFESKSS